MRCPFLRDASVKYCESSAFRKPILKEASRPDLERCSSPDWRQCPAAQRTIAVASPATATCPFLHEVQSEFCSAVSVPRYVPANGDTTSRCHSDGHLYCELFLEWADPLRRNQHRSAPRRPGEEGEAPLVDDVAVPALLSYAPNHMWLDVGADGHCHAGVDAFLARVIEGSLDRISFASSRGVCRPAASLRVRSVDLQLVFPNPMQVTAVNVTLRTNPSKLTDDPYGAGWLFEGVEPSPHALRYGDSIRNGLISGASALAWMHAEADRLTSFAHQQVARAADDGLRLAADGGQAARGLASHLESDLLTTLFDEFFGPQLVWGRSW